MLAQGGLCCNFPHSARGALLGCSDRGHYRSIAASVRDDETTRTTPYSMSLVTTTRVDETETPCIVTNVDEPSVPTPGCHNETATPYSNHDHGDLAAQERFERRRLSKMSLSKGRRPDLPWLARKDKEASEFEGDMLWSDRGRIFLTSMSFQAVMALAIVANAVVIGFETDLPEFPYWNHIETVFLFIFTLELSLRLTIVTPEKYFDFAEPDITWNMFDFLIVTLGVSDLVYSLFETDSDDGGLPTLFRIIRLLRILRIFKIVRFLKQLYMLAFGFVEAAQAVFWVTILMTTVLYVCSIILVRTVGLTSEDDPHKEFLEARFGCIVHSMLTLFEVMSTPNLQQYQDLLAGHVVLTCFLIAFIIFGSFGMIALLTGVISESMFEKNQLRIEDERLDRESKRKVLGQRCAELFDEADQNDRREASKQELLSVMPFVAELFESHYVTYTQHDLDGILDCMEANNSGFVSKDAFCHGILSIAEGVRPMSIMELHYAVALTKSKVEQCDGAVQRLLGQRSEHNKRFDEVCKLLQGISAGQDRLEQSLDSALRDGESGVAVLDGCDDMQAPAACGQCSPDLELEQAGIMAPGVELRLSSTS